MVQKRTPPRALKMETPCHPGGTDESALEFPGSPVSHPRYDFQ